LAGELLRLETPLTERQAEKVGAVAADELVLLALRDNGDDTMAIELRGMTVDGETATPEQLFRIWLMFAQTLGQMDAMPIEQRQLAMKALHHWHHHTAPTPVNEGYPC
jgi:hypothetical protein